MVDLPLNEISARAREVHPGRVIVTFLAGLFFVPGWLIGRAWYGLLCGITAFRIGFRQGAMMPPKPPPSRQ